MALPRYQRNTPNLGRSGVAIAQQAQANSISSFVQGIQGLKAGAINQMADASTQQAKQDAEKAFSEFGIKAKVNNSLTVYGKQYTASLEAMHVKQLAIDTNAQMENIYTENKDNPASFEEISNAYYKATAKVLPSNLQADYAIDFEANKARYSGLVSKNRMKLDKEKSISLSNTIYTQSYDNATQASREGDPIRAGHEMEKAFATLDADLQEQNITADEYRKRMDGLKYGVSKANFKGANDRNIERGDLDQAQNDIDAFRKTTIIGFNDEQRESLADEMQRDLNSELRLKNNQSKTKIKYDNQMVKDQVFLLDNAETLTNEEINKGLESNASPDMKEKLLLAREDNKFLASFNTLNLENQEKAITAMSGVKSKSADDLRLLQKSEKFYAKAKKQIDKDPIMYGADKAFKTEVKELDMQDEGFMSDTSERINQARLTSEYTKKRVGFFTKGEVSSINTRLPSMSASDKLGLIDNINKLPEDLRSPTYKQFKGEIEFAGTLSASGNKDAARISLLGKSADVELPEGFKKDLGAKIANAYGGYNGEYYSQNLKGITNYAKGLILEGSPADDIDELLTNSVGKMLKYNNKTTILPQGVDKKEFEAWLDDIVIEGKPNMTKGLNDMTDVFGSGNYQLHHAGHGEYYIKVNNDGNPYFARNPEDETKPYILRYGKD